MDGPRSEAGWRALVHIVDLKRPAAGFEVAESNESHAGQIADAQAAILARLAKTDGFDAKSVTAFSSVPMLTVTVTPAGVAALERLALSPQASGFRHTIYVEPDPALHVHGALPAGTPPRPEAAPLADTIDQIGASQPAAKLGATGQNQVVVVIDSGVSQLYPTLANKVDYGGFYTLGSNHDCNGTLSHTCFGPGPLGYPLVAEPLGHGSQMALIACGSSGVAPDAACFAIRVANPQGEISFSDVAKALEVLHDEYVTTDATPRAVVLMSLGLKGLTFSSPQLLQGIHLADAMESLCAALTAAKVPVVVSAGNDGADDALSFPACLESTIAVGAAWKGVTAKTAQRAEFSNWSPTLLDIVAPATGMYVPVSGDTAKLGTGTSLAAPQVAGAIALLQERFPCCHEYWVTALKASDHTVTVDGYSKPLLRVDQAVEYLKDHCPHQEPPARRGIYD